ncbi:MAG: diphosphomevalonate decarboxylase [Kofleriaceae bacterium]|nr:diphosphomevalonate decarboxylase [Kofleriaceae bacterium]
MSQETPLNHPYRGTKAQACANIALVKYWGKRNSELNLPAAGSLSLTLDKLRTTTSVYFDDKLSDDEFFLDDAPSTTKRLSPWLDIIRNRAGITTRARVVSNNGFPTSSGLASSASAFAALAVAASHAAGLQLSDSELSVLARRGSGSAARSIFSGLVEMHPGTEADGSDSLATSIASADDWQICMVIAIVGGGVKKSISSRQAMDHCSATSPLYQAWIDSVPPDIKSAKEAIGQRDLEKLGAITEGSAMAMHAAALASRPPIRYWQPATLACLNRVSELREEGISAYPTMDAGPHVKVLTSISESRRVADAMSELSEVSEVIISASGPGASLIA